MSLYKEIYKRKILNVFILFITVSLIVLMPVISKNIDKEVSSIEIVFFRYISGLFCLFSIFMFEKNSNFKNLIKETLYSISFIQILRVFSGIGSLLFLFYASQYMSVADLRCTTYLSPVFASILSYFVLREIVSLSKKLSFILSIIGMFIYFSPWENSTNLNIYLVIAVFAALLSSVENICIKIMSLKYRPFIIILFVNLFATFFLLICIPFVWKQPDLHDFFMMALLGPIAIVAQFFYIKSLKNFSFSTVMLSTYFGIIISAVFGKIFYNENVTVYGIFGIILIVISGFVSVNLFLFRPFFSKTT